MLVCLLSVTNYMGENEMKQVQVDVLNEIGEVMETSWFGSIGEALEFAGTKEERVNVSW